LRIGLAFGDTPFDTRLDFLTALGMIFAPLLAPRFEFGAAFLRIGLALLDACLPLFGREALAGDTRGVFCGHRRERQHHRSQKR